MIKINDIPLLDRPREKALRLGVEKLSDVELLALVIGSGTQDNSALDISFCLFNDYHNWFNLCARPRQELLKYKGIGQTSSVKMAACFEVAKRYMLSKMNNCNLKVSIFELLTKYRILLFADEQESLVVVYLNAKQELIHEEVISRGSENKINVSFRSIARKLILNSAKYYYLMHNHPSNRLKPSADDIVSTKTLMSETEKLGIVLLDHFIIGENQYFSMKNHKIYDYEKNEINN